MQKLPKQEKQMIKHIGKHGDRKVAIVFREIPNEEHMALVVYTETMPVAMHDSLMKIIENTSSQNSDSLGDVLFRELFNDGRPALQTLHAEGMLKKVQTKQIVVTPNATSHVNLEEMNRIINEMAQGAEAIERLQTLDNQSGMTGTVNQRDEFGREIGAPNQVNPSEIAGSDADLQARQQPAVAPSGDGLSDDAIAQNLMAQAERMEAEAKGLMAESKRLITEAKSLLPKKTTTRKKTTSTTATKRTTRKKSVANEASN